MTKRKPPPNLPEGPPWREALEDAEALLASDEAFIAWWDGAIDARFYTGLERVAPRDAALLLAGLHPEQPDADSTSSSEVSADDLRRLRKAFEAQSEGRDLLGWRTLAHEQGLTVHSWFDKCYSGIKTGRILAKLRTETQRPIRRFDPLTQAIEAAADRVKGMGLVVTPDAVWNELWGFAEQRQRPFLGTTSDGRLVWRASDSTERTLTRNALRKRLSRLGR